MPNGLPVALLLFVEASGATPTYGPIAPVRAQSAPAPVKTSESQCPAQYERDAREIVICAPRPQGYRLDPDVLEARREKKQGVVGRPHNPHETFADHSCATVGPMGCRGGATINILAAATTAMAMANRLAEGQEIGSMFQTTPERSEYQLYVEAKKRREAKEEAEAAAKLKAAAEATAAKP